MNMVALINVKVNSSSAVLSIVACSATTSLRSAMAKCASKGTDRAGALVPLSCFYAFFTPLALMVQALPPRACPRYHRFNFTSMQAFISHTDKARILLAFITIASRYLTYPHGRCDSPSYLVVIYHPGRRGKTIFPRRIRRSELLHILF